jgi:ABC-type nitrate/sulfonate/bicarbonate transport system permease component
VSATGRRIPWPMLLAAPVSTAVLAGIWQLAGSQGLLGSSWVSVAAIARFMAHRSSASLLGTSLLDTAREAAIGALFGFPAAVCAAVVAATLTRTRATLDRVAVIVQTTPAVAVGPILVTVIDRALVPMITAGLGAFFLTYLTAVPNFAAIRESSAEYLTAAGAGRWRVLWLVRLPATLPVFVEGLRLAAPAALVGALLGEWFGFDTGIGALLLAAQANGQRELLWACAVTVTAASLAAYALLTWLAWAANHRFRL